MANFLKQLSLFTLVTGAGIFAWNRFMPAKLVFHKAWFILALFFAVTAILHWSYTRAGEKGGQQFVRYFLATTTLKLFFFLLVIVVYVMTNKEDAMHFAVCFLILYILYTIFETFHLLKHFKKK